MTRQEALKFPHPELPEPASDTNRPQEDLQDDAELSADCGSLTRDSALIVSHRHR
ncbi:MAG TPA: hypothetical protein VHA30_04805 [Patescibacteria group bacterium]|nr:hypothetical protein [Patescibacteria group bacterium]